MRTYIEHLRSQPESHRKKVAFGTSAAITALVAVFWATSFSYFNDESHKAEVARQNSQNSPVNVIRQNIAGVYESLTGSRIQFVKDQDPVTETPTLEYVPEPGSSASVEYRASADSTQ
jgi:hypothetical protein